MIYKSQVDHIQKGKATAEKLSKQLEQQLSEMFILNLKKVSKHNQ